MALQLWVLSGDKFVQVCELLGDDNNLFGKVRPDNTDIY